MKPFIIISKVIVKFLFLFLFFGNLVANLDKAVFATEVIPPELQGIGITEKLGEDLPLELFFVDENGASLQLKELLASGKPTLLTLVYYGCPNLCGFLLNGLMDTLKQMSWTAGDQFQILTVSIDARETPDLALDKKENYLKEYGRLIHKKGWKFLTGKKEDIQKLANSVGFGFRYDEKQDEFAHAAVVTVISPSGKISRYLYGIQFNPKDLKLALLEAAQGKIGNVVDQFLLFCYHYDPIGKTYALFATRLMKVAAGVTVLGIFLFVMMQKKIKRKE